MEMDNSSFYTFLGYEWIDYEVGEPVSIVAIIFFILLTCFGATGNGLVVLAFWMNPQLRTHSLNVFMVQTSIVNLIVSAIINPVYIITVFVSFDDLRTALAVDYATIAVMHLGNAMSMYSLCAVATNRYLLIAHPKTAFQILCVPRRRVAGVIATLWLATILTAFPYWAFLYYDLYVYIDSEEVFERLKIAGYVLNCIWFLPVIIVPIMHIATLRVIRSSRKRIEGTSNDVMINMQRNDIDVDADAHRHGDGFQEPTALTMATDKHDDDVWSQGTHTGGMDAGTASLQGSTGAVITDNADSPDVKHCCTTFCSRFCWTRQATLNVQAGRNRDLAQSELRLMKMMFFMYIILVMSLIPAILSFTPVIDKGPVKFLNLFAFFIPIYPASLPYIFLWSNKNFRSGAAKIIQNVRMYFRRRVQPN